MPWNRLATSEASARGRSGSSTSSSSDQASKTDVSRSRQPAVAARQPAASSGSARPGRPQLPQHAHVAGLEVLVEQVAGDAPLLRQRAGGGEELALALEQLLVLAVEHLDEQALLAAEVVVDEREAHARPVGHRARARAAVPVLDQHLARRVDDPVAGGLAAEGATVGGRA